MRSHAPHLAVTPDVDNVDGYTSNLTSIQPDPQFAAYASTSTTSDLANSRVLLPGNGVYGPMRYVLGPAGLTAVGIQSTRADYVNGNWVINLTLSGSGSADWDRLAQQQFHAVVGMVVNGQVISAPLNQPTQPYFTSFNGMVQIASNFSKQQAQELAARL